MIIGIFGKVNHLIDIIVDGIFAKATILIPEHNGSRHFVEINLIDLIAITVIYPVFSNDGMKLFKHAIEQAVAF